MTKIFKGRLSSTICLVLILVAVGFTYQNCAKVTASDVTSEASVVDLGNPPASGDLKFNISETPGYVCSAFGTTTVPSEKAGLRAELRYMKADSTRTVDQKNSIYSVGYFNDQDTDFIKSPATIYLADVNVPTRIFLNGFQTSSGESLKDNQGNILIEYFALKMESVLKLTDTDPEGYYELASFSDDGAIVQIQENGQWVTIINNDGAHSTRMGCADNSRKIAMTKDSRIPIRIYYNQGPRDRIANVLAWNYRGPTATTAANVASDTTIHSYCTKWSNDSFWNSVTSAPNTWINDVFSEGWTILKPGNFQLPDNEVNPCSYSQYDVNPRVSYDSISDLNKRISIQSQDSTVLTIQIFKLNADGSKALVKSISLPESQTHTFETGDLEVNASYLVEVVLEIPAKQLKVLKSWNLKISDH